MGDGRWEMGDGRWEILGSLSDYLIPDAADAEGVDPEIE
jgi:hypothetical protein